jgi:hypothetical protein
VSSTAPISATGSAGSACTRSVSQRRPRRQGMPRSCAICLRQLPSRPARPSSCQPAWPASNQAAQCWLVWCTTVSRQPSARAGSGLASRSSATPGSGGAVAASSMPSSSSAASASADPAVPGRSETAARCSRRRRPARHSARTASRDHSSVPPPSTPSCAAACSIGWSTQPQWGLTAISRSSGQVGAMRRQASATLAARAWVCVSEGGRGAFMRGLRAWRARPGAGGRSKVAAGTRGRRRG